MIKTTTGENQGKLQLILQILTDFPSALNSFSDSQYIWAYSVALLLAAYNQEQETSTSQLANPLSY